MDARMSNDLITIKALLHQDAVVEIAKAFGMKTQYRGWLEIEQYYRCNPAQVGYFKNWAPTPYASSSPSSPVCDSVCPPMATVVRWTGEIYKLGWRSVQAFISVDRDGRI